MAQINTSISQGKKSMTRKDLKSRIKAQQANINSCSLSTSTARKNRNEMRTGKLTLREQRCMEDSLVHGYETGIWEHAGTVKDYGMFRDEAKRFWWNWDFRDNGRNAILSSETFLFPTNKERVTMLTFFWMCLWNCFQNNVPEKERLTLNVHNIIPFAGALY